MDANASAVTLMTLHSAKGLEFNYVFIAGLEENIFPHKNCLDDPEAIEEERRLCYVGVTRARKKLYLLSAVARRQYGTKRLGAVSRFIDEIPKELVDYRGRMPVKKIEERYFQGNIEDTLIDTEPEYDTPQDIEPALNPGQRVKHAKMGEGQIVKIEPYGDDFKITVSFKKHGKKVLSAQYANLQKL